MTIIIAIVCWNLIKIEMQVKFSAISPISVDILHNGVQIKSNQAIVHANKDILPQQQQQQQHISFERELSETVRDRQMMRTKSKGITKTNNN